MAEKQEYRYDIAVLYNYCNRNPPGDMEKSKELHDVIKTRYRQKGLKCYSYEDGLLGASIFNISLDEMQRSEYIICIITRGSLERGSNLPKFFGRTNFFQFLEHEKEERFIIIGYGVQENEMPSEWSIFKNYYLQDDESNIDDMWLQLDTLLEWPREVRQLNNQARLPVQEQNGRIRQEEGMQPLVDDIELDGPVSNNHAPNNQQNPPLENDLDQDSDLGSSARSLEIDGRTSADGLSMSDSDETHPKHVAVEREPEVPQRPDRAPDPPGPVPVPQQPAVKRKPQRIGLFQFLGNLFTSIQGDF